MIKSLALGLAAFAALAVTNPKEEDHARRMVEQAKGNCDADAVGKLLCGGMTALASAGMGYDDHLIYSTARLGNLETVGALGTVVVVSGD